MSFTIQRKPGTILTACMQRFLPTEPKRRQRTIQTALACMFTLASLGFMVYGVVVEAVPFLAALMWALVAVLGGTGFIVAVRSGWSERFADPSLTVAQMLFAITCCAVAYGITGALRGAVFTLLMVVLLFSLFSLKVRHVVVACAYAVLVMGAAMAMLLAWHRPEIDPLVEAGHLLMLTLMMPAVVVLAQRLHTMRSRVHEQKRALSTALDRIQFMATRDDLTGVMNRRHVTELLERELQRQRRQRTRLSVALFDLDHFKLINDRYGHACGDEVLKAFAAEAQQTVRGCDALARWGGEEFLLLMPDTPLEEACMAAGRVRATLERKALSWRGQPVRVSLSAGVAESGVGETIEVLVERADQALYAAKAGGRNRVEMAPQPSGAGSAAPGDPTKKPPGASTPGGL